MSSQYITESDLSLRMGSTRFAALGGNQTGVAAAVIGRADAVIDGFASAVYATPLTSTPLIQEWALAIAEYELYKRGPGSEVPGKIKDSYKTAIAQLSDLAARRIGTGGPLTLKTSPAPIRVQGGCERQF